MCYVTVRRKTDGADAKVQQLAATVNSNSFWELREQPRTWSIDDLQMRSTLATAIALLNVDNRPMAHAIFRYKTSTLCSCKFDIIPRRLYGVHTQFAAITDATVASDVLLLLTMARHHAAFDYAHREKVKR